jgi:hypothetical protein
MKHGAAMQREDRRKAQPQSANHLVVELLCRVAAVSRLTPPATRRAALEWLRDSWCTLPATAPGSPVVTAQGEAYCPLGNRCELG